MSEPEIAQPSRSAPGGVIDGQRISKNAARGRIEKVPRQRQVARRVAHGHHVKVYDRAELAVSDYKVARREVGVDTDRLAFVWGRVE